MTEPRRGLREASGRLNDYLSTLPSGSGRTQALIDLNVILRSPDRAGLPVKKVLHPRRRAYRHPAEVTADRLGDHLDRWYDTTDGRLRDAIAEVRCWLDRLAEEAP